MQHNSMVYRSDNRSRSMGVGPMRSRPMEKRHDTSPYSGVPYLSPPPPDTWRRTNSDSALHQSANEACQSTSAIPHRRGSDACWFSLFFSYSEPVCKTPQFVRPRSLVCEGEREREKKGDDTLSLNGECCTSRISRVANVCVLSR